MDFEGFHGTDSNNEKSILNGNFFVSSRLDEWLGTGAYFFLEGISDPLVDACQWAKLQAYDKGTQRNSYESYVVIKARISAEKVLRLDTFEGIKAFNVFRDKLIEIMKEEGLRPNHGAIANDCIICNFALDHGGYDAVVNCEYIKLDKWTRMRRYSSRIPTCRIISVKAPDMSVRLDTLETVARGLT